MPFTLADAEILLVALATLDHIEANQLRFLSDMAVIDVTGLRLVTDDVTGDVDHVYVVLSDDEGTSTVKVDGDLTQFLEAFSISKDSVRIGNARVSTGYSPSELTPSSINL